MSGFGTTLPLSNLPSKPNSSVTVITCKSGAGSVMSQLPTGCLSFSVFQKPLPTLSEIGPPIFSFFLKRVQVKVIKQIFLFSVRNKTY